jgi:hypothetical protein
MNTFHERNLLIKLPFPVIHIQMRAAVLMAQIIFVVGYKIAEIYLLYGSPFAQ